MPEPLFAPLEDGAEPYSLHGQPKKLDGHNPMNQLAKWYAYDP